MKSFPYLALSALTLTLIGAGCAKSLEARVSQYEDERKICIDEKKSSANLIFNGQTRTWDSSDQIKAEYSCSTVDLATKYYQQDPEGIIELCVRTKMVGMYTYEEGFGTGLTLDKLEQLQTSESFSDVTIDSQGKIMIGDTTLKNWREGCRIVIEGVIGKD